MRVTIRTTHKGLHCKVCKDFIASMRRHDFKNCSCGNCFVDGGFEYFRGGAEFVDSYSPTRAIVYITTIHNDKKVALKDGSIVHVTELKTNESGSAFDVTYKYPYSGLVESMTVDYDGRNYKKDEKSLDMSYLTEYTSNHIRAIFDGSIVDLIKRNDQGNWEFV